MTIAFPLSSFKKINQQVIQTYFKLRVKYVICGKKIHVFSPCEHNAFDKDNVLQYTSLDVLKNISIFFCYNFNFFFVPLKFSLDF